MSFIFKELDSRDTPLGFISLRRRAEPRLDGRILLEVKLGDEFLMSSLFTEAEEQLARLAMTALANDGFTSELDVVVGGLGLGYTAAAALEFESVRSLSVIELMEAVIDWHQKGLVDLGETLTADDRCLLVQDDFFARALSTEKGFDATDPEKLMHAVLLDIDHTPQHWLDPQNERFYSAEGLALIQEKMHPGGVFGLWSDAPPHSEFLDLLRQVFASAEAQLIEFPNPFTGENSSNTVYLARRAK